MKEQFLIQAAKSCLLLLFLAHSSQREKDEDNQWHDLLIFTSSTPVSCLPLSRLCETSLTGKYSDMDGNLPMTRSIGLFRSQEPLFSEDIMVREQLQKATGNRSSNWHWQVKFG